METSFDLLSWRSMLIDASAIPTGHDLKDWAERLSAAGEESAAFLLRDVAALLGGVPSRTMPEPPIGSWTLHLGMAELRRLAQIAAAVGRPRLSVPERPLPSGRPDNPLGIGKGEPAPQPADDIAATAGRLRALLKREDVDEAALSAVLTGLVEAGRRNPSLDYRRFARSPLTALVPAIAAIVLIDFALSTRDLWSEPMGSPGLFHHVARLQGAGLGPYLGNVDRLVRDSLDLADLARIGRDTARDAGDAEADVVAWAVLLSRGCRTGLLNAVVDDLGDIAAGEALSAILDRAASRPPAAIDTALVMRLRDAALDNADYALAARAQRVVVGLRPGDRLESVILGSIEASGGAFANAEAIFRDWLDRFPDDVELRERLRAVEAGRFSRFAVPVGFGSPPDRRDARLRRRGVPPGYPRRQGARIRAVDVGG